MMVKMMVVLMYEVLEHNYHFECGHIRHMEEPKGEIYLSWYLYS